MRITEHKLLRLGKSVGHFQGKALQEQNLVTQIITCSKNRRSNILVAPENKISGRTWAGKRLYQKVLRPNLPKRILGLPTAQAVFRWNNRKSHLHGWMPLKMQGALTNAHLVALMTPGRLPLFKK